MKYSIAIVGFIASFVMAVLSVAAIGRAVWIFISFYYKTDVLGTVPANYWPIVWTVAGAVGIAAGISSFRATSRRGWIRSFVRPLFVICTILLVVYACLAAFVSWRTSEAYWIRTTVRTLRSYPPPPASSRTVGDGKWTVRTADRQYLIFSNGWAYFTANRIDGPERFGAVAILCASDGTVYISHHNFDVGITEFSQRPQPKDLQDFLWKYVRWEKR
jgi:hypothetical protein